MLESFQYILVSFANTLILEMFDDTVVDAYWKNENRTKDSTLGNSTY